MAKSQVRQTHEFPGVDALFFPRNPCVQMLLGKRDEAFWLRQVKQPSIGRPAKSNAFREFMERRNQTSSKLYHHSVLQSAQGQPFRLTKTNYESKPLVNWLLVSHCACRTCTRKITKWKVLIKTYKRVGILGSVARVSIVVQRIILAMNSEAQDVSFCSSCAMHSETKKNNCVKGCQTELHCLS